VIGRNNLGGAMEAFGIDGNIGWQSYRTNTCTATTSRNPTTLTCIGDDAGVGSGVNDIGAATGDYVDLSWFVTSGATALNASHIAITRVDATHFTVPINTTANHERRNVSVRAGLQMSAVAWVVKCSLHRSARVV
jgi:hypothetical protein